MNGEYEIPCLFSPQWCVDVVRVCRKYEQLYAKCQPQTKTSGCVQKTKKKNNNPHLRRTWRAAERGDPAALRRVGHAWRCMYLHACLVPGPGAYHRCLPGPPLRPFPVLLGETSLSGGQQQSDSGNTAGGVFWWGGDYPQVPGPGISRLRAAWISRRGQIIPPCRVLPQI